MEALAAALSGRTAIKPMASERAASSGIDQVTRGIRLRDGRGIKSLGRPASRSVRRDDPLAGPRGRADAGATGAGGGVNRTAATPLDIDLLFDTCLPITVDEVVLWQPPSRLIVTAAEGVMLTAPVDMVRLWPELWPNEKAAYRTIQEGVPVAAGVRAGRLPAQGAEDETAPRALRPDGDCRSEGVADEPARGFGGF